MDRAFSLGSTFRRDADTNTLTVDMAFASEQPYERWWGIEVLQMKGARLARLNDGDGGPVLFNHDWNDLRGRHVPGTVRADKDGVLRGQIEIPAATQATRDAAALVESRTLTKASVGYQIHTVVEKTTKKSGEQGERVLDGRTFERLLREHRQVRDGREVGGDMRAFHRALDEVAGPLERAEDTPAIYLVTDWEPLENSLVTVPADNSVGVGRSLEPAQRAAAPAVSQPAAAAASQEKATMADTPQAAAGTSAEPQVDYRNVDPVREAQRRREAIENMAKANGIADERTVRHWVESGKDWNAIADDILKIKAENTKGAQTFLDMPKADVQRYSLWRAMNAVLSGDWRKAGLEAEASKAIAEKTQRASSAKGFFVPLDIQERLQPMRRDLTVASASGGGYLVGTENMSFIDLLRNRSVAMRMGATRMPGLTGNVTVPKQTAGATAYWLSTEGTAITEGSLTFGQLALSPKTVGAYVEVSRLLMLQSSPAAETLVTSDLAAQVALAADLATLHGSGSSGQPTGITATASIGSVTGTSLAYAGVLEFQTDVASNNVMPMRGGYVTTPAVAGLMAARSRFSNTDTPLWQGNIWDGQMGGFPAMSSNQVNSATMIFGDWSQVVIGEWGVLEVSLNEQANFPMGVVGFRAFYTMDVGVRYAGAFSVATSIT